MTNDDQHLQQPETLGGLKMADLIRYAMAIVTDDSIRTNPLIPFFLTHDYKGGWEAWLQAEYARMIGAVAPLSDFDRELAYPVPGPVKKCDLWFQGTRGAPLWIELKAQRRKGYKKAVQDFKDDILKIQSLPAAFLQANVNAAIVALVASATDVADLQALRVSRPSGTLTYMAQNGGKWFDVTNDVTKAGGHVIIASWVPYTL